MDATSRRSLRVRVPLPIRVRGMSIKNKFFDEESETILLSKYGLMTQLKSLVELDTEIHVVSLKKNVAGTFRVVWVNTQGENGYHQIGLELNQSDGEMWDVHFPPAEPGEEEPTIEAWLECQRCHKKQLAPVPQAELEHLNVGVLVARHCEHCRSTTAWEFTVEDEAPPEVTPASPALTNPAETAVAAAPAPAEAPASAPAAAEAKSGAELRTGKRSPVKLTLKVMRHVYGADLEDICQTINVSRNGAYFLTGQNYQAGEVIQIILPYKPGQAATPVKARVVRQDETKGALQHAVAVHMEAGVSAAALPTEGAGAGAGTATVGKTGIPEKRGKSRVPLKMTIMVIRKIHGTTVEDIGETINISRTGAYFQTTQKYEVGEMVEAIMPYKKGDVAFPVSARVVRVDQPKGIFGCAVALFMQPGKK